MSDIFVKVDGIEGEATDSMHDKWIRVLSVNHGVSQPHSTANSGGGSLGGISRSEHADFQITKLLDKSSPKLFLQCCNGKRIPKVTIEFCRQVDDKMCYQKYELDGALVRHYDIHGSSGADENPSESFSLAYEKVTMTYTEVDPKTNKPKGDTMANWDVLTNVGG